MANSLLSAPIGIPDGAYTLLQKADLESAFANAIQNSTVIQQIITQIVNNNNEGDGGSDPIWAETSADGTKDGGSTSITLTPSRSAIGVYLYTISQALATYGVHVTASTESGDGGGGVTTFLEFDTYEAEITGDTPEENFFYSAATEKIYVLCEADDLIHVHDTNNFAAGATTINPTGPIRTFGSSGIIDTAGEVLWLSGDTADGGYAVRAIELDTETEHVMGATLDRIVIAATSTEIYAYTSSTIVTYTPNLGTNSLGSVQRTYSTGSSWSSNATMFDDDGNLWCVSNTAGLACLIPGSSEFTTHAYPSSLQGAARPMYDSANRCLYVSLATAGGGQGYIYKYSGWNALVSDSGTWELIQTVSVGGIGTGIWYDPTTGVLYQKDAQHSSVAVRFLPASRTIIDSVEMDDSTPDNPQVDYDMTTSRGIFYLGNYGYITATKGSDTYMIRLSYNGDEIGESSGGSFVASVLTTMYRKIDSTHFEALLFRSINPIVRADGKHTVSVVTGG